MIKKQGAKTIVSMDCAEINSSTEVSVSDNSPTTSASVTTDDGESTKTFADIIHSVRMENFSLYLILFLMFSSLFFQMTEQNSSLYYREKKNILTYRADINVQTLKSGNLKKLTSWTVDAGILDKSQIKAAKRYFRIGTKQVS